MWTPTNIHTQAANNFAQAVEIAKQHINKDPKNCASLYKSGPGDDYDVIVKNLYGNQNKPLVNNGNMTMFFGTEI